MCCVLVKDPLAVAKCPVLLAAGRTFISLLFETVA